MINAQIHFPDEIANQIQANLQADGETFEQFVQKAVAHELQRRKANDLKSFFDALQPLESFADIDAVAYVDDIRSTGRLLNKAAHSKQPIKESYVLHHQSPYTPR